MNKNNNKKSKQVQVHDRDKTENNKYTKIKNRKKMTNDTNCPYEINAIPILKNTQIKINKNYNENNMNIQVYSTYKTENKNHMQIRKKNLVTKNTKCHSEMNITYINKNIRIKIGKNNNDSSACAQAHGTYNSENNKYIKIESKKKTMTNNTKCHSKINVTYINKNTGIKINKNNNERNKQV
jgi:hypothetical protein